MKSKNKPHTKSGNERNKRNHWRKRAIETEKINKGYQIKLSNMTARLEDGATLCKGYQDMLDKERKNLATVEVAMQEAVDEIQVIERMRDDVPAWVTLRIKACCERIRALLG